MRIKNMYNRDFVSAGTTILTSKPFAYVLRSLLRNERCDYCLQR